MAIPKLIVVDGKIPEQNTQILSLEERKKALTLIKMPLCFPTESQLKELTKPPDFAEAASKTINDWTLTIGNPIFFGSNASKLMIGTMTGFTTPRCKDQQRLEIIGKMCGWLFIHDDEMDLCDYDTVELFVNQFRELCRTYRMPDDVIPGSRTHLRYEKFLELMGIISKKTTKEWQQHFLITVSKYNDMIWFVKRNHLLTGIPVDLAKYNTYRSDDVAGYSVLLLVEYGLDIKFTWKIWNHPLIRELMFNVSLCYGLRNDNWSWSKEFLANDDFLNLFSVYWHDKRCDLQTALDQAFNEVCMNEKRFYELRDLIMADPELSKVNGMRLYLDGLYDSIMGFVVWTTKSRRYSVDGNSQVYCVKSQQIIN